VNLNHIWYYQSDTITSFLFSFFFTLYRGMYLSRQLVNNWGFSFAPFSGEVSIQKALIFLKSWLRPQMWWASIHRGSWPGDPILRGPIDLAIPDSRRASLLRAPVFKKTVQLHRHSGIPNCFLRYFQAAIIIAIDAKRCTVDWNKYSSFEWSS